LRDASDPFPVGAPWGSASILVGNVIELPHERGAIVERPPGEVQEFPAQAAAAVPFHFNGDAHGLCPFVLGRPPGVDVASQQVQEHGPLPEGVALLKVTMSPVARPSRRPRICIALWLTINSWLPVVRITEWGMTAVSTR
jgi:hypothetical protein